MFGPSLGIPSCLLQRVEDGTGAVEPRFSIISSKQQPYMSKFDPNLVPPNPVTKVLYIVPCISTVLPV